MRMAGFLSTKTGAGVNLLPKKRY